ncbi:MAG: restriction endonuclease subunit S [Akkermansia sp.]|nr:restriction endonuclease subunit S [Akkermansia sp.]
MLNHKVKLQQGEVYPFVDMPSVGIGMRAPDRVSYKEYTGGGVKFARNDTLIARIEPCLQNGKRFYFREGEVGFGSTEYIVFSPKDDSVDPMFLFYYLNQECINKRFESAMAGTSGRRRVDTSFLDTYRVLLPEINNQKRIAAVLSIIDDKIELNRRINDNLAPLAA